MGRAGTPLLWWLCLVGALYTSLGQLVNVATGKTYNQSSIYGSCPSSSAANGNTNGDYPNNCIHTADNDYNPWWQVDLGRNYTVSDITVWAREGFIKRLYPMKITVDGRLCVRANSSNRQQSLKCDSPIYGQVVRLSRDHRKAGNHITLNLCEFQSWVCPDGYYGDQCNRACSSIAPGCGQCFRDGTRCTKCSDNFMFPQCTDCVAGFYGDRCSFNCSTLTPRCTQCDQGSGQCTTCSGNFRPPKCTGCNHGYYKSGSTCVPCSSSCRYNECDSESGRCDINVATGKTYRQSSTFSGTPPSSSAANGETSGGHFRLNCIRTGKNDSNPWWQVDLGRNYTVSDITVWARARRTEHLYPLIITVDGQLCVRANNTGGLKLLLRCLSPIYGQVVRVSRDNKNEGNDVQLNLCEFQIWVCPDGYYGDLCQRSCFSKTPRCSQCFQDGGQCTKCSGNFTPPQCTELEKFVIPVVGAVIGVGLTGIVVMALLCWRLKTRGKAEIPTNTELHSSAPAETPQEDNDRTNGCRPPSACAADVEDIYENEEILCQEPQRDCTLPVQIAQAPLVSADDTDPIYENNIPEVFNYEPVCFQNRDDRDSQLYTDLPHVAKS